MRSPCGAGMEVPACPSSPRGDPRVAPPGTVGGGTHPTRSGALRTPSDPAHRHAVALVLCAALLVVPLAALHGGDASAASDVRTAPSAATAAPAASHPPGPARRVVTHRAPSHRTPARPAAATAAPVAIAAAPVLAVAPTTTAPPPTTTTVPPTTTTTTTTTAPVAATSSVETTGQVTYYDHPAGRCASPWLPFGTVVQVTNPATGATVTCTVDDREADTARAIDLATSTFALLAPLSQGVVDARLRW